MGNADIKRNFPSLVTNSSKVNPNTHQINMDQCKNPSIVLLLQPVAVVCRIFGVLPLTITADHSNSTASFVMKKKWISHSILILLVSSCYMCFQAVSLILSISKNYSFIDLVSQSLWLNSGVVAYAVSVFMLCRGQGVIRLFKSWCKIETDLERLFCIMKTKMHIRAFQIGYCILALSSAILCMYHAIKLPYSPVYPLAYFEQMNEKNQSYKIIWTYAILQGFTILWKWAGFIVLEGICCLFATLFMQCMSCLITGLDTTFCYLKSSAGETRRNSAPEVEHTLHVTGGVVEDALSTTDHHTEILEKLNECPIMKKHPDSPKSKDEYLILVIQKLQTMASLQTELNNVLGPLIFLNVSQLVILTCALTFLPVKYYNLLDFHSTIIFVGNGLTMFVRLVVLIVCLGNVYSKGQDVNMAIAKAMSCGKLSTVAQNPAMAYLTVYSANPISFNAWGFFPITRGTLLAALSLISTYTVIFVQIQM